MGSKWPHFGSYRWHPGSGTPDPPDGAQCDGSGEQEVNIARRRNAWGHDGLLPTDDGIYTLHNTRTHVHGIDVCRYAHVCATDNMAGSWIPRNQLISAPN